MGGIAGCLHLSPAIVTLDRIATRAAQFILIYLTQALQAELEERIKASLTNIETPVYKQSLVEYETGMVAATIWLLSHQTQLNPVPAELICRARHCSGHIAISWTDGVHVPISVSGRFATTVFNFFHPSFFFFFRFG